MDGTSGIGGYGEPLGEQDCEHIDFIKPNDREERYGVNSPDIW